MKMIINFNFNNRRYSYLLLLKNKINYLFKSIINIISLLWSKIISGFGYKYDESVIPYGPYCYKPDDKRNINYGKDGEFVYYTIPCRYYKIINKNWNGCKFYGIITDDYLFDDRCKMCNINIESDQELIDSE